MDFSALVSIAVVGLIAAFVLPLLLSGREKSSAVDTASASKDSSPTEAVDLVRIANRLESLMEKLSHPSDVLENADFQQVVSALAGKGYSVGQVSNYALGANWILACAGYEALSRRDDSSEIVEKAVKTVPNAYAWPLFFLMRFVDARSGGGVAVRVLCGAQYWWANSPVIVDTMTAFLNKVIGRGETIVFGHEYAELGSDDRENVGNFIKALPHPLQNDLQAKLRQHTSQAIDWGFLRSVGVILDRKAVSDPVFETEQIGQLKKDIFDDLDAIPGRSMLLVGTSGVGKSAFVRSLSEELILKGWTVLKTSAAALIADQAYIGQIEGQIRRLARNATVGKKVAIYVENMSELRQLGRYKGNDNSVLDLLWADIASAHIFLIGETTPAGMQALLKDHPSLPTVMRVATIDAASEGEAARVATSLLRHLEPALDERQAIEVVTESLQLAQQYLTHKSLPGSVLSLLHLAVLRARRDDASGVVGREHVLGALSQVSGLPRDVLDEQQQLDIDAIAESFRSRIVGQDEAVDCLVERIAMLKAGLTDPGRPIGVFLFAGPTGTGKTEIAKTLADILFGTTERMIRLDMSEFQDAGSASRLIGHDDRETAGGSLVDRIREDPFSVLLLDELEKAHPKVWDMFLQVFDDGRLTDSIGRLADFRHAIIILTSNLGATISNEAGIGFTSTSGGFSAKDVMRVVNRTFRREFINRLDRVVVFRPLSREVMRIILENELGKALGRRGIRSKQWAVEWEDSAIEFLLAEGFTPDLGARPLRRAIERHLLTPLSITMVQNRVPAGEQFLFVRSNGDSLSVEFIDPDADSDVGVAATAKADGESGVPGLASLMVAPQAFGDAGDYLARKMSEVMTRVRSDEWADDKSRNIEELNKEGFWERADRHRILDRIELIDRLDSAASVLSKLSVRLQQHPGNSQLVKSIAGRLYVLNEGLADLDLDRPTQAYLGVRMVTADVEMAGADEFLQALVQMYLGWARNRGMRIREIDSGASRYDALFKISGFGSFGILQPECGLHVFEIPKGTTSFDRLRARVEVAGVPADTAGMQADRDDRATKVLDESAGKVEIVRRYRRHPSPLVRDSVRQWRSGRLDAVLAGGFDILGSVK